MVNINESRTKSKPRRSFRRKGKKRSAAPASVESILSGLLTASGQSNILNFGKITAEWMAIMGPQLGRVSQPADLKRKTLTVWVSEPVWADSMTYMRRDILTKVNALFDRPAVGDIKIIQRSGVAKPLKINEESARGETEPLARSIIAEVDAATESLPDSELRLAFKRVMLKDRRLKSKRIPPNR